MFLCRNLNLLTKIGFAWKANYDLSVTRHYNRAVLLLRKEIAADALDEEGESFIRGIEHHESQEEGSP